MDLQTDEDVRTLIYDFIKERGIAQSKVGKVCGMSKGGIHNILKLRSPLPEDKKALILDFLGIEFKLFLQKRETTI